MNMISVKCTYSDGNTTTTRINETVKGAKKYFLGKWFNFGDNDWGASDNIQQCIKVELID